MHEGWEYVVASYAVAGVTLGVWFWMILAKLRRLRDATAEQPAAAPVKERVHG